MAHHYHIQQYESRVDLTPYRAASNNIAHQYEMSCHNFSNITNMKAFRMFHSERNEPDCIRIYDTLVFVSFIVKQIGLRLAKAKISRKAND